MGVLVSSLPYILDVMRQLLRVWGALARDLLIGGEIGNCIVFPASFGWKLQSSREELRVRDFRTAISYAARRRRHIALLSFFYSRHV